MDTASKDIASIFFRLSVCDYGFAFSLSHPQNRSDRLSMLQEFMWRICMLTWEETGFAHCGFSLPPWPQQRIDHVS